MTATTAPSTSRIHIEGMGLLGSLLADALAARWIDFTWSDLETPFCAWRASTGLAYPDADPRNLQGLERWHEALELGAVPEAARAPFLFAHKANPHGASDGIRHDYGLLRRGNADGVVLNVSALVERVRAEHAERRAPREPGDLLVVARPTLERTRGYSWGWSARVSLELPEELQGLDPAEGRPVLYGKAHRFDYTYAYPSPGTDTYLVGSAMVSQRTPKPVPYTRLREYLLAWRRTARELLGVRALDSVDLRQGWRPQPVEGDSGRAEWDGERWTMPQLGSNGMRQGLLVIDELLAQIGLLP